MQLWQLHVAEQMILSDMEADPDKYKDKNLSELTDDGDFDEENSVEYTKAYYKKALIPKAILVSGSLCLFLCICLLYFIYLIVLSKKIWVMLLSYSLAENKC